MKKETGVKTKVNLKSFLVAFAIGGSFLLLPEIAGAAAGNIGDIGTEIKGQMKGVGQAIYYIALTAGVGLVALSLFLGYSASKPQSQTQWKTVIMAFVFGSALLSISSIINVGASTLGQSADSSVSSEFLQ